MKYHTTSLNAVNLGILEETNTIFILKQANSGFWDNWAISDSRILPICTTLMLLVVSKNDNLHRKANILLCKIDSNIKA